MTFTLGTTTPQTPSPRPAACLSRPGARVRFIPAADYIARLRAREAGSA